MAYGDAVQFVTSAARTTTGNSGAQPVEKGLYLNLLVEVTAASGTTPTLDFTVEWSGDGTNWATGQPADSFTQITAATVRAVKQFVAKAPFYRLVWTVGGTTPSFTFSSTRYTSGQ
jgi:hypothetical protein